MHLKQCVPAARKFIYVSSLLSEMFYSVVNTNFELLFALVYLRLKTRGKNSVSVTGMVDLSMSTHPFRLLTVVLTGNVLGAFAKLQKVTVMSPTGQIFIKIDI